MKKKILASLFVAALFSSCAGEGSSKGETPAADSVAVEATVVEETHGGSVVVLSDVAQLKTADKPVILDFNAVWCGPCKKFAPHFESVSKKMEGKAAFISVDIDKWGAVADEYGVQSIPTVVIVKPNGEKTQFVGYMTEEEFETFVNSNI